MSSKDMSMKKLLGRRAVLEANVEKRQADYDRLKDKHSKKLLDEDKKALSVCEKQLKEREDEEKAEKAEE